MEHLSGEEIKYFISNYGDGDVYFSHKYQGDCIVVKYFPALEHCVEPEGISILRDEVKKNPALGKKYLNTIVLTETGAEIIDGSKKRTQLVETYLDFLKELRAKKYATKKPFSYLENFASAKESRGGKREREHYKK